jgi:hypothetical protein
MAFDYCSTSYFIVRLIAYRQERLSERDYVDGCATIDHQGTPFET